MAGNLDIWKRFADIDPQFTKAITGKPYKGTSPNPHYVIQCLTEMFGPVGVGFGWEVEAEGFQPLGEEVLHWCRIRFWHSDQQSRGFSAYGQTKALMKTRNGMMSDEDAPKKSLTDAITKAAAQVGVASNIFLGRWDDNKYVAQVEAEYRKAEERPVDHAATRDRIKAAIATKGDAQSLDALWSHKATKEAVAGLPEPMQAELQKAFTDKMGQVFQAPDNVAAE